MIHQQQLEKYICLVKIRVSTKNRAQYYAGKVLECAERKEWNKKKLNSKRGNEMKFIDRKLVCAVKVEGRDNGKENESLKEEGKQYFRTGGCI